MSTFEIPELKIGRLQITLVGDSILVTNQFHQEIIEQIEDAQTGKAVSGRKGGRPPKVPTDHFLRSLHVLPGTDPILHDEDPKNVWAEGRFGFPAVGIKAAAVRAATQCGMKMTDARQAFHIDGDLCEIECSKGLPKMRRDAVRPNFKTTDLAYRGEFTEWKIAVTISYNEDVITPQQIVNLFYRAGYGVGIGAFRPEHDGQWGRFHVAPEIELLTKPD
jgi:hypothetical protein